MTLKVGDQAPDFNLVADDGKMISLQQLRGKNVILYFYPKDNTPGCTKEACDFRDSFAEFPETVILGVSKDKPSTHKKFKEKYQLPFTLLTDENADVCEAYGVINKKSIFGKTFLGIERSTFLIDKKGMIRAIWRKVTVNGHIQQVINEQNRA